LRPFRRTFMENIVKCRQCGHPVTIYRNPFPTTDILIQIGDGIVLIKRKNPPYGWAIPGGFIDYGESAEHAAIREAEEETSIKVTDLKLFNVYSAPDRDPRYHTLSVVFTARGEGEPRAGDDAEEAGVFTQDSLPSPLAFDHADILDDFFRSRKNPAI
jgi:ADP-ribose pyrophosphatase YjhB (NUDIX family)